MVTLEQLTRSLVLLIETGVILYLMKWLVRAGTVPALSGRVVRAVLLLLMVVIIVSVGLHLAGVID